MSYIFPGLILLFICSLVIYSICLTINYIVKFARTRSDLTRRYTKAIEQLGSDNTIIRLGGIYALERIAKESERSDGATKQIRMQIESAS